MGIFYLRYISHLNLFLWKFQIFGASSRIAVWDAKEATEKLKEKEKEKEKEK